jgi:hypothetical protein
MITNTWMHNLSVDKSNKIWLINLKNISVTKYLAIQFPRDGKTNDLLNCEWFTII